MYINESLRYRGLSMSELDEIIYAHQMAKGRTVDLSNVLLVKPGISTQELARKVLDIISEIRTAAIPLIIGREPDEYRHDVMIHFGEGLNKVEALCKKQLTATEENNESASHARY